MAENVGRPADHPEAKPCPTIISTPWVPLYAGAAYGVEHQTVLDFAARLMQEVSPIRKYQSHSMAVAQVDGFLIAFGTARFNQAGDAGFN